jgi:K+-sensing histidine kinase KdpD
MHSHSSTRQTQAERENQTCHSRNSQQSTHTDTRFFQHETDADKENKRVTLERVKRLRDGDAEIVIENRKRPYRSCDEQTQTQNHDDQRMDDSDSDQATTWHISRFIPAKDPATGKPAILVVENDVSQLEQMKLAVKAREKSQRQQQYLFSAISHELRTPLNGILGLSESLIDENNADDSESVRDVARIIHSSACLLKSIVNDILDGASLQAGKLRIHVEPLALDQVVTQVRNVVRACVYIYMCVCVCVCVCFLKRRIMNGMILDGASLQAGKLGIHVGCLTWGPCCAFDLGSMLRV